MTTMPSNAQFRPPSSVTSPSTEAHTTTTAAALPTTTSHLPSLPVPTVVSNLGKRGRPASIVRQYWQDVDLPGVGPKCIFCDHRSRSTLFRAPPATRHTLICKYAPQHVKDCLRSETRNKYSRRLPTPSSSSAHHHSHSHQSPPSNLHPSHSLTHSHTQPTEQHSEHPLHPSHLSTLSPATPLPSDLSPRYPPNCSISHLPSPQPTHIIHSHQQRLSPQIASSPHQNIHGPAPAHSTPPVPIAGPPQSSPPAVPPPPTLQEPQFHHYSYPLPLLSSHTQNLETHPASLDASIQHVKHQHPPHSHLYNTCTANFRPPLSMITDNGSIPGKQMSRAPNPVHISTQVANSVPDLQYKPETYNDHSHSDRRNILSPAQLPKPIPSTPFSVTTAPPNDMPTVSSTILLASNGVDSGLQQKFLSKYIQNGIVSKPPQVSVLSQQPIDIPHAPVGIAAHVDDRNESVTHTEQAQSALVQAVVEAMFNGTGRKKEGIIPTPAEFRAALADIKQLACGRIKRQRNEARAEAGRLQLALSALVGPRSSTAVCADGDNADDSDSADDTSTPKIGDAFGERTLRNSRN